MGLSYRRHGGELSIDADRVCLFGVSAGGPLLAATGARGLRCLVDYYGFAADAELTLLDHAQGPHAFDVLDDSARTREIIEQTVAFLQTHLREKS